MIIALWLALLVLGVLTTSVASRRAVRSAVGVAEVLKVSPALVGLTVVAIGTDLPEIANSLVTSATDHGDINVGDSLGSAVTQMTLTLALLCLAAGPAGKRITTNRNFVVAVGTAAVFAAFVVRLLVDDGDLSRVDGLILIVMWLGGTLLLGQGELRPRQRFGRDRPRGVGRELAGALGWLGGVGAGAVIVVESFLRIAEILGVPEFIGSFIALSIGTSLPELFVDWTAIRRGASSMAVGDIFGSSFVDCTLSVGIGPAVFGVAVSSAVFTGTVVAAAGMLVATIIVARSPRYDWRVGVGLLVVYALVQAAVLLTA